MASDNARWTEPFKKRTPRRGWWDDPVRRASKDEDKGAQQIIDDEGAAVLEETDPTVPQNTDTEEIP